LDNTKKVSGATGRLLYIKHDRTNEACEDITCPDCGALLYRVLFKSSGSVIEIKCRKCGTVYRSL
jgi:hypothetical protein